MAYAITGCHVAEENLQATMATQQAQTAPSQVEGKRWPNEVGSKPKALGQTTSIPEPHSNAPGSPTAVKDGSRPKQTRRRGRSAKVGNQKSKIVEWWKPGWQKKVKS